MFEPLFRLEPGSGKLSLRRAHLLGYRQDIGIRRTCQQARGVFRPFSRKYLSVYRDRKAENSPNTGQNDVQTVDGPAERDVKSAARVGQERCKIQAATLQHLGRQQVKTWPVGTARRLRVASKSKHNRPDGIVCRMRFANDVRARASTQQGKTFRAKGMEPEPDAWSMFGACLGHVWSQGEPGVAKTASQANRRAEQA